jgi:O-antigen/teichoic acid export membrane protein
LARIKFFIEDTLSGLKKNGSFTQNYAFVLSGTGLSIIVQILVSPVLTRIYGTEAYGIFSVFNALCSNLAVVATLRFPQALLLPDKESDFYALMRLSLLSALFTSGLLFVILFIAATPFLSIFNAEKLSSFYYFIPLMIFLIALNQVAGQWQYRLNTFKSSVTLDTSVLISVRIFNLIFGWVTSGAALGLVIGDILGKTAGLILSWRFIIKEKFVFLFRHISWNQLMKTFAEYKRYPLLNLPGIWVSIMATQLPVFFVSSAFGISAVGLLSLSISMLDLPKRLFAYTVTSVFYRKAVEVNKTSFASLQELVVKMLYIFLCLSVVPYSIVTVFGPELFSFAFGAQWIKSGVIAQYLSIYCVFELLCISLDSLYYVLREEKRLFLSLIITFMVRLVALFVGIRAGDSLESCMFFLAAANFIIFGIQLSYLLYLLKLNWKKHLLIICTAESVCILLFFAIRQLL